MRWGTISAPEQRSPPFAWGVTAKLNNLAVCKLSLFCFRFITRVDARRNDASITRATAGVAPDAVPDVGGDTGSIEGIYRKRKVAPAARSARMAGIYPAATRQVRDGGFRAMSKRQRLPYVALLALIVSAGLSTAPLFAQVNGPEPPNSAPQAEMKKSAGIKMNVEMALVNVTVTDPYSRLVTGLDKENFKVYEDGVEQEISTFSSEDVPISIGLIFDMSGSMADKVDKARQAAIQFMRTANPRDEFFLVSFNDRAELTSRFTSNIEELESRMMFTIAKGRTALLDAIYLGLSQMRGAKNGKRALLIISDGGDNHSRYNEADIRNFLKEADCQLYAMGVFDVNDMGRTTEERYGPSLLSELAEMTGGRVFPVSSLGDLPDIAAKIGMELRNQYVLGYKPSDTRHNGTWRKIKVKLLAPKGLPPLNVYAKTGYYAPAQ